MVSDTILVLVGKLSDALISDFTLARAISLPVTQHELLARLAAEQRVLKSGREVSQHTSNLLSDLQLQSSHQTGIGRSELVAL